MCLYTYVYIHICSVSLDNPNNYPKEMKICLNKRIYMNFKAPLFITCTKWKQSNATFINW